MTCLITIPLKKGYDVDLIKPLKNLISSYYSSCDNQVDLTGPIEQLNKLRQSCVSKNLDTKNESSLELYQKYYDQISSLESKCPPNEIQIPFKWKNAFDKGNSFFISTGNMTLSNIRYEKVCVLFNIAAIATQMSNSLSDNLKNDAFLKNSAKNYQLASGIFLGLKQLVSTIGQELTWDLNGDLLKELSLIMLAQAQEIFFFKAYNDNLKNSILAKICKHCFDLYFEASSNIDALNSEKEFLAKLVSIKQCAFAGLTEYFQALVCQEEKKIGEELVRFSKCIEYLEDAEYIAESNFPYSFSMILEKARRSYAETKKDNDFIYHAIIPAYQSLNPVQRAEIAKPTSIPVSFLKNPDPFSNLLPVTVQQAITKLDLRKNELVTTTINSLREAVKNLNSSLAMMNLPAAVEDTNNNKLPDSLLKKSQEIRSSGGFLGLESKFSMLPDLLKRNEEIYNVTNKLIIDEENTDSNLRKKYGDKYTILASENVNKYWKEQLAKYRSVLDNAIKADSTIRAKFETNKSKFLLLSKSEKEITESLPSIGYGSSLMKSEPAQKLRSLLCEVDNLRKEAVKLEEDLKNQTFDDMKNKFLSALQSDGAINEEALSVESLGQTYGPLQKQLRTFLEKEEDLQSRIQVAFSDFSELKNKTNSNDQRDVFLTDLAKGSDVFEEITRNINEGTNFYNDLTKLLISLQNRINDFCFARETERNELVDFLSKNNTKEDKKSIPTPAPTTATQNNQPNMPFAAPQYPNPYPTPYPQVFYPPAVPQGYGAYPSYYVPGQYNPQAQHYPYPPPQNYPGYPQQPPNQ